MALNSLKTWQLIRVARAASQWPSEKFRRVQERQLRKLLAHAYANVSLYRRLYDEAGFRPELFRSLDDLQRIPVLSKRQLKEAAPGEVIARGVDPARCQIVDTSGSSGVPLRVYLGPEDQRWHRAVAWRILFEHGFRWTDHSLEIRMTFGDSFLLQRFGVAPKDWVSILEPPESWARRLARGRHEVVMACASSLEALAEAVEALRLPIRPPRIIISDSEMLFPATRRLVHRALGTDPVDVFGLVELSNFAWQCEQRDGFHTSADSHIVEVAAPTGEIGPLIVTALGMWTMPIIRYDTGDVAAARSSLCDCGRTLPVLGRIHGRVIDFVILASGRRLFWPFFHEILSSYPAVLRWQVVQDSAGRVTLRLAATRNDPCLLEQITTRIRAALPEPLNIQIERVDSLRARQGEKLRVIVSEVGARPGNASDDSNAARR
jgi:phenylacetate-CoA ligase